MKKSGRKKRSIVNILVSLASQVMTVIVGMLLPRALILNYGSETNGIITSLQQIISYLTLIEGGLLSAVAVSLYTPVAQDNINKINSILYSAKKTYNRLGVYFFAVLVAFSILYPYIISETAYCKWQLSVIVLLIGVNGATQILFIGKYKALMMAAQMNGMILAINALSTVLYSSILIIASYYHIDILLALSLAVISYIIRSVLFYGAVKYWLSEYSFSKKDIDVEFPQRNDAFYSQVLSLASLNGCVVILSVFRVPMEIISVYTTYNLVLSGIFLFMYSIENSMTSAFGNLLAEKSLKKIQTAYIKFDIIYHFIWSVVIADLLILLLPFIKIYTSEASDVNYILDKEAFLFVVVGATWMLRNQQTLLMSANGSFRNIRNPMFWETAIVLVGGGIGYYIEGLSGMLLAKIIATIFVLYFLVIYTYKKMLSLNSMNKIYNIFMSLVAIGITYIVVKYFSNNLVISNFTEWVVYAIASTLISILITSVVWYLGYNKQLKEIKILN